MKYASLTLVAGLTALAMAQPSNTDPLAPRPNGMSPATPASYILLGGTIHISPTETIAPDKTPMILIENGRITGINPDTSLIDIDINGRQVFQLDPETHIYAGFIDPYIEVSPPAMPSSAPGAHWSDKVTPRQDALRVGLGEDAAKSLREMGFTTAMIAPSRGIFRGWSGVVSTAADFDDPSQGRPPVYKAHAGQVMGFERGGWGDDTYPTSHMGVVALMRQTFIDADARHARPDHTDESCLDAIDPAATTLYYNTSQELEALLADNIAREFDHKHLVIVDNGTAHRRLHAFKEMGYPVIVPLRYPEAPDVAGVGAADSVELATLQHWERAPANARWLHNSGLTVALTTSKLRQGEKFWDNLHTAIEKGLPQADALEMVTTAPAQILGLSRQGTIEQGNIANLVVASGNLFDPQADAQIIDTWVGGRRHHINDPKNTRFDGDWTIRLVGSDFQLHMAIDANKITITAGEGDDAFKAEARKVKIDHNQISFVSDDAGENPGTNVITGTLSPDGTMRGSGIAPDQQLFQWTATRAKAPITMRDFTGTWHATLAEQFNLDFKITKDTITVIEQRDDADDITQDAASHEIKNGVLSFTFEHEPFGAPGVFTIGLNPPAKAEGENTDDDQPQSLTGIGTRPDGQAFTVTAVKEDDDKKNEDDDEHKDTLPDLPDTPFGPFAYEHPPEQQTVLLTNARVWTQSDKGILDEGWVLIKGGKVAMLGTGGYPKIGVDQTIDAKGMQITPGLIDAHSHTGVFRFGANESGQAVTAECRISDSIDPGHPGYYRELAGGLTAANLLHGSANPIGGQSKTIKLRWNSDKPSDMFFEGAKPGIKFALGENVKQSNWGDGNTTRYPQTRMGVETLIRDRFIRAREYDQRWNLFTKLLAQNLDWHTPFDNVKSAINENNRAKLAGLMIDDVQRDWLDQAFRKEGLGPFQPMFVDYELEALAEILRGERLVHCHSYRQDEILMLCRIAEEFDFKIGTFQHGLETYKVAEIVKEHAIGVSIFSDWWAYKVEVQDAIPYAGPIDFAVGILTSYNSDDDDLARRMNVEAGKALKYAKLAGIKMTPQDALSFVTLNPAIQLGIDDRVGSLEPGKDADLVVWTGNPLSPQSRPEMTFVDGRLYFSRDLDAKLQARNNAERRRLIQKIIGQSKPNKGGDGERPSRGRGRPGATPGSGLDYAELILDHPELFEHDCDQALPAWNTDY